MNNVVRCLWCAVLLIGVAVAVQAQYLAYSFKADAKNGERIYKSGCVACHGKDGKGTPTSTAAFKQPDTFPDITRCDQTTAEVNTAYRAVIVHGGPNRGFSQIMPSCGEALSSQQFDDVILGAL